MDYVLQPLSTKGCPPSVLREQRIRQSSAWKRVDLFAYLPDRRVQADRPIREVRGSISYCEWVAWWLR